MSTIGPSDPFSIFRRILDISFLLLVGSLGFLQIPFHVLGFSLVTTDILFLITALFWLANILSRKAKVVWSPFYWCLFGYLAALFCSALFSINVSESFKRFLEETSLICLCILAINVIDSVHRLKRALSAWLIGTSFAIVIGLTTIAFFYVNQDNPFLPYLTYHYGSVPVGNYPRITATFVSASMFCNYLNVSLIIALIASVKRKFDERVSFVLIVGICTASAFTFSIGLGGIFLAFAGWMYLSGSNSSLLRRSTMVFGAAAALFFLVISIFALTPYPNAKIWFRIPGTGLSLMPSARVLVWRDAVRTFIENPINGIGLEQPVAGVTFSNTEGSQSLLSDAHNTFLQVAAESGTLGLAAILSIVIFIMRRWWKKHLSSVTANRLAFGLGLAFICGFIYQGLMGSFEHARHLWVLIGMFVAADRLEINADQNS